MYFKQAAINAPQMDILNDIRHTRYHEVLAHNHLFSFQHVHNGCMVTGVSCSVIAQEASVTQKTVNASAKLEKPGKRAIKVIIQSGFLTDFNLPLIIPRIICFQTLVPTTLNKMMLFVDRLWGLDVGCRLPEGMSMPALVEVRLHYRWMSLSAGMVRSTVRARYLE